MSKLELPTPRCTYADHSCPAYSKQQMLDFAEASRRAALEEVAAWIEPQRNDVAAHGFEFAAAIRKLAKDE